VASYFYARDISRIFRVTEALESGMVGVNTDIFSNEVAPLGGVKQSGLGAKDRSTELKIIWKSNIFFGGVI
jgi:succinate-semialdehyde dehydrogenase / glutarate-semialdehyde dehydrogenase